MGVNCADKTTATRFDRPVPICLSSKAAVFLLLSNPMYRRSVMSTKNLIKNFEAGRPLNKQQKNVLIVYAHQEPQSFNGALLRTAVETLQEEGHSVEVSDLYAMHFEPRAQKTDVLGKPDNAEFFKYQMETMKAFQEDRVADDIKAEMEKLKRADLVIFQFPLYWFSFPAILKGWFDRVYIMGFAYGRGKLYSDAPMAGKKAMLSFTTGGPATAYFPTGMNGDMNVLLWPLQNGALRFVGFDVLAPQISYAVAHASDDGRKKWLADWSARLKNIFTEKSLTFVDFSNFDSALKLSDEFVAGQKSHKEGVTVGQNLGKPYASTGMLKP